MLEDNGTQLTQQEGCCWANCVRKDRCHPLFRAAPLHFYEILSWELVSTIDSCPHILHQRTSIGGSGHRNHKWNEFNGPSLVPRDECGSYPSSTFSRFLLIIGLNESTLEKAETDPLKRCFGTAVRACPTTSYHVKVKISAGKPPCSTLKGAYPLSLPHHCISCRSLLKDLQAKHLQFPIQWHLQLTTIYWISSKKQTQGLSWWRFSWVVNVCHLPRIERKVETGTRKEMERETERDRKKKAART